MATPNASSPADPQVLTLFQEELARAYAMPGFTPAGPVLWPRFAGYYQGLARLPRKLRRALQRRWRRSLGGIALLCALGQAPALAADISVFGGCTLVDAITAANNDTATGGCTAGSGPDRIFLSSFSGVPPLTTVNNNTYGPTGLPVITSEITISGGPGSTITRDSSAPQFRILAVGATGNLTLQFTTVTGGVAVSSEGGGGIINKGNLALIFSSTVSGNSASFGGGIHSDGPLTLTDSTISGNSASVGGGISNRGTLTVMYSTVSGNTAGIFGGGISGGPLTLTSSRVSGNTAGGSGGGIYGGELTLTNGTVSGNSAGFSGGGMSGAGPLTLTSSRVSGNSAGFLGGGINGGGLTLLNSTVYGNSASLAGGLYLYGEAFITNSTIEGNTAATSGGGGVENNFRLMLTNSTVSGNTAADRGGGVNNFGTVTFSNSTVSGNSAGDRGGGVENSGTVTLTSSTVSRNASGRVAGGLFNTGTVTLVQSLLSGNTATVNGAEAYSVPGPSGPSTVIADGSNVVGHDGSPGIAGFTLGASDVVPADPFSAILDPTLDYNGGATRTHALVFGSPAVDAVLGTACAIGTDQRGAPRAQDGDGDTLADCDSGAVERGQVPVQASLNSTRLDCKTAACRVPVTCNLTEVQCTNKVEVTVRRPRRNSDGTVAKAPRLIRFAAGAANIPPGGTGTVSLKLTKQGKRLVRATKKRRLKGVLGIREIAATVSNTPLTISRTDVAIRLKRRK